MPRISSATDALAVLYRRSGLTLRGVLALTLAAVALASALMILAVTSEDVIGRNGLATDDPLVLRFVTGHRTGWLVELARSITDVGAVGVLGALALMSAVLLWIRGARLILAIAPGVALGVGGLATAVTKQLVHRPRPPLGLRLVNESEASFPSGHTTDSTAFLVALALVIAVVVLRSPRTKTLVVAGAALLAAAVGASRLELGVHWPTDVIAGYALGLSIAIIVATGAVFVARAATRRRSGDGPRPSGRLLAVLAAQRHATRAGRGSSAHLLAPVAAR